MIAGDFNQWPIQDAVKDFSDIVEVDVGHSRGTRSIDRTFINFSRSLKASGTLPPLTTEPDESGRRTSSDHKITYTTAELKKLATFEWLSYSYRFYNDDSVEEFKTWVLSTSWDEVLAAEGSNAKADHYQRIVTAVVNACFPLITTRRKSTDLPWVNALILSLIHI